MVETMLYRKYKQHYSDCKTIPGTYDKNCKTIQVDIPEGRMKNSGVRGQHFHGYELWLRKQDGTEGYCVYRAVSKQNAMKQHTKWCKENGWQPIDTPEGKIAHIY
jgi:hypothetical protein